MGSRSRAGGPWVYFTLTFAFSWAFTVPLALSGAELSGSPIRMVAYGLGGLGPAAAAIWLTYRTHGREGRRDYWRRIVDARRIPGRWYAVIFLTVPALTGVAALLDVLLGGQGLALEAAARFLRQPLAAVPFALFVMAFGPIPEEMGWRGYGLDRLQARHGPLVSSLILGAAWALWHLPQFFIPGTYQHGLGFGSTAFGLFMLNVIVISVLYTWIYNNTARSTLSAILFHFMINFVGELFALSPRADVFYFGLMLLVAVGVALAWRMRPQRIGPR